MPKTFGGGAYSRIYFFKGRWPITEGGGGGWWGLYPGGKYFWFKSRWNITGVGGGVGLIPWGLMA